MTLFTEVPYRCIYSTYFGRCSPALAPLSYRLKPCVHVATNIYTCMAYRVMVECMTATLSMGRRLGVYTKDDVIAKRSCAL